MAKFRIASLQKSLSESVPELELQLANKRYNELTSKYRDLLQKENVLISRSTGVENLEASGISRECRRCFFLAMHHSITLLTMIFMTAFVNLRLIATLILHTNLPP